MAIHGLFVQSFLQLSLCTCVCIGNLMMKGSSDIITSDTHTHCVEQPVFTKQRFFGSNNKSCDTWGGYRGIMNRSLKKLVCVEKYVTYNCM